MVANLGDEDIECCSLGSLGGVENLNFHKANYVKIEEELTSIKWSTCLEGQGVEMMWENIKDEMNKCIMKYVPKKLVRKRKYALWMKRKILKSIIVKERLWKKFKERPSHENQMRYKKQRNDVCNEIRRAKADFEQKIAERIKEDPKLFYAYARSKSKVRVEIGPLKWKDKMVERSVDMAKVLNEYFGCVFTKEDTSNIPANAIELT